MMENRITKNPVLLLICLLESRLFRTHMKTKEVSWERVSTNTCNFVHQNDGMQKKDTPQKTKAMCNTDPPPPPKGIKKGWTNLLSILTIPVSNKTPVMLLLARFGERLVKLLVQILWGKWNQPDKVRECMKRNDWSYKWLIYLLSITICRTSASE